MKQPRHNFANTDLRDYLAMKPKADDTAENIKALKAIACLMGLMLFFVTFATLGNLLDYAHQMSSIP